MIQDGIGFSFAQFQRRENMEAATNENRLSSETGSW